MQYKTAISDFPQFWIVGTPHSKNIFFLETMYYHSTYYFFLFCNVLNNSLHVHTHIKFDIDISMLSNLVVNKTNRSSTKPRKVKQNIH